MPQNGSGCVIVADWICVVWQALGRATLVDWISGVGTTLTLASLWLYIWSERAASPRLAIEIGDRAGPTQYPHGKVLWVHVQVRNLPASRWERIPLFILRRPRRAATAVTARIWYQEVATKRHIIRKLSARWAGQVEPYDYIARQINPLLISLGYTRDIPPTGQPEPISIAIKYEGMDDCWAFTQESFLTAPDPQGRLWLAGHLRIPRGDYTVQVEVIYSGDTVVDNFRLSCRGQGLSTEDFDLSRGFHGS